MTNLISFDIDGTLESGDPPGIITMDMVRLVKNEGYIIGSCSDRPIGTQENMWKTNDINVDFTVLKHQLCSVKTTFKADNYYHIGDTYMDEFYAQRAGFEFIPVDTIPQSQVWPPGMFP